MRSLNLHRVYLRGLLAFRALALYVLAVYLQAVHVQSTE